MSIFGKLDAAKVSTNPFWVEQGEYNAEVTDAKYKTNRDGKRQLVIQYTINEEDSQFNDQKLNHYFDLVDEDMTEASFELLPADEKKKIRQNMATLKKTLCGSDGNANQPGLGVDSNDLNAEDPAWDPASLVGTKVNVAVSNYGPSGDGVNIRWVNTITD